MKKILSCVAINHMTYLGGSLNPGHMILKSFLPVVVWREKSSNDQNSEHLTLDKKNKFSLWKRTKNRVNH